MGGNLGFLTDLRRLNVAITRPKHFLFLIGNSRTLKKSEVWSAMIESCKSNVNNGGYFAINETLNQLHERTIENYIQA